MNRYASIVEAATSQYGQPSYSRRFLEALKKYKVNHLIDLWENRVRSVEAASRQGYVCDTASVRFVYDVIRPGVVDESPLYYYVPTDEQLEAEVILMAGPSFLGAEEMSALSPAVQRAIESVIANNNRRRDFQLLVLPKERVPPSLQERWEQVQAQYKGLT